MPSFSRLRRRHILAGGAAAAAGTLLGPRRAHGFGEAPPGAVMLAEEHRVTSILEFYLFGGVSQYESFYAVPAHGDDPVDPAGWHLHLQSGALDQALADCGFSGEMLLEFGADAAGETVYLGPFSEPLRARDDLLERMRICVTAHGALPHEVAVPLALSGRPLGHPDLAGIGAHIQRYFHERDGGSSGPVSYVLQPGSEIVSELGAAAVATGAHPATVRPLRLVVDQMTQLYELLDRSTLGTRRDQHDALVAANLQRYQQRLMFHGAEQVRAGHFGEALAAANAVKQAPSLREFIAPEFLEPLAGASCGATTEIDVTTMSVRLAARLLAEGARYVCVLENGMVDTLEAGGFDTHAQDCPYQARNVTHALNALTSVIAMPNGQRPPTAPANQPLIDLDKTLVIINTEFGRTPHAEGAQAGRGHWPYGYPVIMMGGPMRRSNGAIYGATDPAFEATEAIAPVHHRIAALLSLGIWPFEDESYNVSDVTGAFSENEAAESVIQRIFAV